MLGVCRICCRSASSFSAILSTPKAQNYLSQTLSRLKHAKEGALQAPSVQISQWQQIAEQYANVQSLQDELRQLSAMESDGLRPLSAICSLQLGLAISDSELSSLIASERLSLESQLDEGMDRLARNVVPLSEIDITRKCQLEFSW